MPSGFTPDQIVRLNVGGKIFATSSNTLTWIPETFFTSLLSGRIPTVKDETGAIFIDRDPDVFKVILNYLRTKQVDLSSVSLESLKHEAQFFNLSPLVRRLILCDELEVSSCGSVLFHGLIPPPDIPFNPTSKSGEKHCAGDSREGYSDSGKKNSSTAPDTSCIPPHVRKIGGDYCRSPQNISSPTDSDPLPVRIVRAHYNTVAVAHAYYACVYRMKESIGWDTVYITGRMAYPIKHLALHTKLGPQSSEKMLALALSNYSIHLFSLGENGVGRERGTFTLSVAVDKLFFIGSQMVALSRQGKVGIWQSVNQNWQVQDLGPVTCYDTAGSSLLLGCSNGSMYYIDMQKFPLRMKDNDLLITELYRDPNEECITAISVYLTPKTTICGNWIEIAYGTSSGAVRVIVQHPETVGHGPQLFQTYTVHNSPITKIALNTSHLISVCAEYNHVRTWSVTRFRGMISTQPGSTSLASFKVLTLDSTDDSLVKDYTDVGPFGDQDGEQVFVQRVVPDTNEAFVRLASTGDRICTIKTVDSSVITSFTVHECEGSSRMGSRPRRYLFCGTAAGNVQMWDLSTAMDQYYSSRHPSSSSLMSSQSQTQLTSDREQTIKAPTSTLKQFTLGHVQFSAGPTPQELLQLMDQCDISCNSICNSPSATPGGSSYNLADKLI